jgi:hypothetical protein
MRLITVCTLTDLVWQFCWIGASDLAGMEDIGHGDPMALEAAQATQVCCSHTFCVYYYNPPSYIMVIYHRLHGHNIHYSWDAPWK